MYDDTVITNEELENTAKELIVALPDWLLKLHELEQVKLKSYQSVRNLKKAYSIIDMYVIVQNDLIAAVSIGYIIGRRQAEKLAKEKEKQHA